MDYPFHIWHHALNKVGGNSFVWSLGTFALPISVWQYSSIALLLYIFIWAEHEAEAMMKNERDYDGVYPKNLWPFWIGFLMPLGFMVASKF